MWLSGRKWFEHVERRNDEELAKTSPLKIFLGCYTESIFPPGFSDIALGPLLPWNDTNPTDCTEACLQTGYELAAMAEGEHCLCGMNADSIPVITAGATCDLTCDDGSSCGSSTDPMVVAVFETGGGSPNFTLYSAVSTATEINIGVTPVSQYPTFYVDFGYGAPLSYFNDTTDMTTVTPFYVPDIYSISIIRLIAGTTIYQEQSVSLVHNNPTASVDILNCPVVWEPDLPYYCNVSVSVVNDSSLFTATFDDTSEAFSIQGIGAEFYRLGNPPPRALTEDVDPPGLGANVIRLTEHPVMKGGLLYAFDVYAFALGAYTISIQRPTCASGVYCVQVRGCMTVCPLDESAGTHTCPAPQWLCPNSATCNDAVTATTCMAPEALPSSWTDVAGTVVSGTFAALGFFRLDFGTAPIILLPGDIIHVTGPIGRKLGTAVNGDEVDGILTNFHHYVEAIVKEPAIIAVSHECTTVNVDVNVNVVDVTDALITLSNHTSCERNITDIDMIVYQDEIFIFDPSLNVEFGDFYYVRTNVIAKFIAVFSVAGPVEFTYTYEPDFGQNDTFTDINDYPLASPPHRVEHVVTLTLEGVYLVTIAAENQHNLIPGPVINQTTVYAQHEVVSTWTVTPDSTTTGTVNGVSLLAFKIPTEAAKFRFIDTAVANFPTNASASLDWGDGSVLEILPFTNPGDSEPVLEHIYTGAGVYNVSISIYNVVSRQDLTCQVLIIEEIKDFVIINKYFPLLTSTTPRDGFGKTQNQFPKDQNLTFYPAMSQGTVDRYIVEFTNNNSEIMRFEVVDLFNPIANFFHYHFDVEEFLNLTVIAVNIFETVKVDIFIEMVGQVRIIQINDFSVITEKNESKTFEISYESLGGGTCLVVDWGDSQPLALDAYGEESTCMTNFSHATYHSEPLLEIANNFTHSYA
ncbi:hypothetical protein SK128_002074 [Halocaridina rubra]|uniref:PKD domain-containing protein n=1 Tax=Halocaridina rubra TaxID=373956 RepID=A0AAN9A7Q3_HALRR